MYNTKLIITKNGMELYKYSKVIQTGSKEKHTGGRNGVGDRNRSSTLHKAKTKILRIVNSNTWTYFITLTYAEDITIEESKKDICRFIKKLRQIVCNDLYPQFRYLYVIELTKRGRPHFHVLVDFQLVDYDISTTDMKEYERYLAEIWSHGFTKVKQITNSKGAGHYISKYLTKEPIDTSCKLYGYSRNCSKPLEVKCLDTREPIEILKDFSDSLEVTYCSSYEIEYNKNKVNYYVLEDKSYENKE